MDYRKIIKEIGRGKNHARDLDRDTARGLYAHMLNSEVPDLELGGVLIALRIKGEGEAEMLGFYEAMQNHTIKLTPPAGKPMPIVIPSYNGARKQANLTPLLAILLHKLGFPVVVHGVSEDRSNPRADRNHFRTDGYYANVARRAGAGEARRTSTGVYACRRVLPAAGKTTGDALADGRA